MASLTTSGNIEINPKLFDKFEYQVGICNGITQPTNLNQFKSTEEDTLRGTSTFTISFNRIVRINTTHDLSNLVGSYSPTFIGLIMIDKTSGDEVELLAIEPFTEVLQSTNNLTTTFNLTMSQGS